MHILRIVCATVKDNDKRVIHNDVVNSNFAAAIRTAVVVIMAL